MTLWVTQSAHQYAQVAANSTSVGYNPVAPQAKIVHIDGASCFLLDFKTKKQLQLLNKLWKRDQIFITHQPSSDYRKNPSISEAAMSDPDDVSTGRIHCDQWRRDSRRCITARSLCDAALYSVWRRPGILTWLLRTCLSCPLRLLRTWWRGIRNW